MAPPRRQPTWDEWRRRRASQKLLARVRQQRDAGERVAPKDVAAVVEIVEHALSPMRWAELLAAMLPALYAERALALAGTDTPPGSYARTEVYRRRALHGAALSHPRDLNAGDAQAASAGPDWLSEAAEPRRVLLADGE